MVETVKMGKWYKIKTKVHIRVTSRTQNETNTSIIIIEQEGINFSLNWIDPSIHLEHCQLFVPLECFRVGKRVLLNEVELEMQTSWIRKRDWLLLQKEKRLVPVD